MAEERKQFPRIWLWLGAALLLVAVFFVSKRFTQDRLPIHAVPVVRAELLSTVSTNGLVEPEKNFEFHSPIATTVKALYVHQGETVKAGQLLLQLDDSTARARVATAESSLSSAQASYEAVKLGGTLEERQSLNSNIARAKLELAQTQRDVSSIEKLQSAGAASASEVAAARQRELLAQDSLHALELRTQSRYSPAELQRATAAVADAQANLQAARTVLEQTSVHAPEPGQAYSIPVGRSDFVEEGKLLLQVADLKNVRVRAYFDEPEIGRLAIGQKIRIVWDANRGREWHGRIVQLPSTIVTYGTRNVGEAIVAVEDGGMGLMPDTHVTVTVTTASEPNILTVPREALHSENGKAYVYRVVGDTLVRTPVSPGTINLTQVAISSGLSDGDLVATGSLNGLPLEAGTLVKVVK